MVRLRIWLKVYLNVSGETREDQMVLLESLLRIPCTIIEDLQNWQFPMLIGDCAVNANGVGKFKVRAYTDDLFHVLPGQEPAVEKVIRARLQPGDVFVDAGSNIGFYTILASQLVGTYGKVFAIEMIPETAAILRAHVEMNRCLNIEVHEGALASVAGKFVTASIKNGRSGACSIVHQFDGASINVESIVLSDVIRNVAFVKLIKMDLEGAELGALEGLGSDLQKVEAIIFENRHEPAAEAFLLANGYSIRQIDGGNALAERVHV